MIFGNTVSENNFFAFDIQYTVNENYHISVKFTKNDQQVHPGSKMNVV